MQSFFLERESRLSNKKTFSSLELYLFRLKKEKKVTCGKEDDNTTTIYSQNYIATVWIRILPVSVEILNYQGFLLVIYLRLTIENIRSPVQLIWVRKVPQICITLTLIKQSRTDPNAPIRTALHFRSQNLHSLVLQRTKRCWEEQNRCTEIGPSIKETPSGRIHKKQPKRTPGQKTALTLRARNWWRNAQRIPKPVFQTWPMPITIFPLKSSLKWET